MKKLIEIINRMYDKDALTAKERRTLTLLLVLDTLFDVGLMFGLFALVSVTSLWVLIPVSIPVVYLVLSLSHNMSMISYVRKLEG